MTDSLPHIQLDQWPEYGRIADVRAQAASLPNVIIRQSRMAAENATALALEDEWAVGSADAFIDLPEFCHLQGPPQGGIRLTLPPAILRPAFEFGWGEPHLAAQSGAVSRFLVTVYAPRDEREIAVAMALVEASWGFARGEF